MKTIIRRKLTAEKATIIRRLDAARRTFRETPMLAASNIHYELADKVKAIGHGGIGAMHLLVKKTGLADRIDDVHDRDMLHRRRALNTHPATIVAITPHP